MDLKDVVQNVKAKAEEAHSAFHAGHHDVAEQYLAGIRAQIVEYERAPEQRTEDVTESDETEKPAQVPTETPAEVPGAALPATQLPGSPAAQQSGTGAVEPKPPQ